MTVTYTPGADGLLTRANQEAHAASERATLLFMADAMRRVRAMFPTAEMLLFDVADAGEDASCCGRVTKVHQVRDGDGTVLYDVDAHPAVRLDPDIFQNLYDGYKWYPTIFDGYEGDDIAQPDAEDEWVAVVTATKAFAREAEIHTQMQAAQ